MLKFFYSHCLACNFWTTELLGRIWPLYRVMGISGHEAQNLIKTSLILEVVQLHNGVMSHAAFRKLDNRGFDFDHALVRRLQDASIVPVVVRTGVRTVRQRASQHQASKLPRRQAQLEGKASR